MANEDAFAEISRQTNGRNGLSLLTLVAPPDRAVDAIKLCPTGYLLSFETWGSGRSMDAHSSHGSEEYDVTAFGRNIPR